MLLEDVDYEFNRYDLYLNEARLEQRLIERPNRPKKTDNKEKKYNKAFIQKKEN